jgi:hypothetical protein
VLRETMLALLREDEVTVDEHVELRPAAGPWSGFVRRPGVDLGGETRRPAVVASSDGAVIDVDLRHRATLAVASAGTGGYSYSADLRPTAK